MRRYFTTVGLLVSLITCFLASSSFVFAHDSEKQSLEKEILVHTWEDFILPELPAVFNQTYRFLFTKDEYNIDASTIIAKRANPLSDIACYYIQLDGTVLTSISGNTVINFINPPEATPGYCAHFLLVNASSVFITGITINMSYGESVIKLKSGSNNAIIGVTLQSASNVGLIYAEDSAHPSSALQNLDIRGCRLYQLLPNAPDIYLNISDISDADLTYNYYGTPCKYPRIAAPDCSNVVYLPYYVDVEFKHRAPVIVYNETDPSTELVFASLEESVANGYENHFIRGELDIVQQITFLSGNHVITRVPVYECCATLAIKAQLNPAIQVVNHHLRVHNITIRTDIGSGVFLLRNEQAYPSNILSNASTIPPFVSFSLNTSFVNGSQPSSYAALSTYTFLDHVFMTNLKPGQTLSYLYGVLILPSDAAAAPLQTVISNSVLENSRYNVIHFTENNYHLRMSNNLLWAANGTSVLVMSTSFVTNTLPTRFVTLKFNKVIMNDKNYSAFIFNLDETGHSFDVGENTFFEYANETADPVNPMSLFSLGTVNHRVVRVNSESIVIVNNVEDGQVIAFNNGSLQISTGDAQCKHFLRYLVIPSVVPLRNITVFDENLDDHHFSLYFSGASNNNQTKIKWSTHSPELQDICNGTNTISSAVIVSGYHYENVFMWVWTPEIAKNQSLDCSGLLPPSIYAEFESFNIDIALNQTGLPITLPPPTTTTSTTSTTGGSTTDSTNNNNGSSSDGVPIWWIPLVPVIGVCCFLVPCLAVWYCCFVPAAATRRRRPVRRSVSRTVISTETTTLVAERTKMT